MKITGQKRGVALIWAVVVSTILLLVTTTMVNSTIKESRISLRTDSSAVAYAAANSGIDIGRKILDEDKNFSPTTRTYSIDNNGQVTAQVIYSKDAKGNWILDSTGIVGDVSRKLQYKYISRPPSRIKFSELSNNFPNIGSYTQKFSFWFPTSTRPARFNFGYGDSNTVQNNTVWFSYEESSAICTNSPRVLIAYKNANYNSGAIASKGFCLNAAGITDLTQFNGTNKRFNADVRYVDGAAVQITLYQYDFATGSTSCVGSTSLSLSDPAFVNFSKTYLSKVYYSSSYTPSQVLPQLPYNIEFTSAASEKIDIESLQLYN